MSNYAVKGNHGMNKKLSAKQPKCSFNSCHILREQKEFPISHILMFDIVRRVTNLLRNRYMTVICWKSQDCCYSIHFHQAYFIPVSPAVMLGSEYQLLLRWINFKLKVPWNAFTTV